MKKKLLTALLCISLVGQGIMVSAADFYQRKPGISRDFPDCSRRK